MFWIFNGILRIVFTNKKVSDRLQRDFLESRKLKEISQLREFLLKNKIYYPSSGIIFMSTSTSKSDLEIIIKFIKKGLKNFKFKD